MELDSLPRYEYEINEEKMAYIFTTQQGFEYIVTFRTLKDALQDYPEIADIIFELGFERKNHKNQRNSYDEKVRNTILHIIISFYTSIPHAAIFYICDNLDNSHKGRSKLFDKWFDEYEKLGNSPFIKTDYELEVEDMDLLLSLIRRKNNDKIEQTLQIFEKMLEDYQNKMQ